MRRLSLSSRFPICLCGLMVLGGCNEYVARPDSTVGADAAAGSAALESGLRAQLDLPAILDELTGPTSPYCPVMNRPRISRPLAATLGTPVPLTELGSPGVCVIEVSQAEAGTVLQGSTVNGKASKYLP